MSVRQNLDAQSPVTNTHFFSKNCDIENYMHKKGQTFCLNVYHMHVITGIPSNRIFSKENKSYLALQGCKLW